MTAPLALVLLVAEIVHPGAAAKHEPFLEAIAEHARDADDAADEIVWAEHESRFGDALRGKRWDAQARGILQIRGPDSL